MIYDQNWMPKTDNEYQNRLCAMAILLVKAAGGRLVVTEEMMRSMQEDSAGSVLSQYKDAKTGDIIMEVVASSPLPQGAARR